MKKAAALRMLARILGFSLGVMEVLACAAASALGWLLPDRRPWYMQLREPHRDMASRFLYWRLRWSLRVWSWFVNRFLWLGVDFFDQVCDTRWAIYYAVVCARAAKRARAELDGADV